MLLCRRRRKRWLTEKPLDRIPTRWKLVIAGLIGSGTGLLILTMWKPGSTNERSSPNLPSKSASTTQSLERAMRINMFSGKKSPVYCTIGACSTVTCSAIPDSQDPGQIASDFITHFFKVECPTTGTIQQLTFESCSFPNNTLNGDWLRTSLPIDQLTFRNCALTDIAKGAFASVIFEDLKTLEIIAAKIRVLRKSIFQELSNLINLQIDDNAIHEVEHDLLRPVADSLQVLALDGCLKDARVLLNITGGSALSKVLIMSLQRNVLTTITSRMFGSMPNLNSLYLGNSEIESCEVDAFNAMRSLEQLDLKNNLLKNLPEGIFATLLKKSDSSVSMMNNPWNCTCEFGWIKDMIIDHPTALTQIPKCETPERNARLSFTNAKFCDEATTATSVQTTETIPEAETTQADPAGEEDSEFLRFTCQNPGTSEIKRIPRRKLFTIEEWRFPARFQDFFVKTLDDGVLVNLPNLSSGVSLIWFKSPGDEGVIENLVNCVQNVRGPFLLGNLDEGHSYTICLLEELDKAPSPFNCLAIRTDPLPWSDAWLTTQDKVVVFSVSLALIIIVSIISVLSSFLVIRRNPSLLRGSKRIVMVRKRDVDALVLPQGVRVGQTRVKDDPAHQDWNELPRGTKISDPGYLTPLNFRKCLGDPSPKGTGRKDSKASRMSSQSSGGSYVSGIEPTLIELAYWRNNGKVRSYSTCLEDEEVEEPPPLPPLPSHREVIPSLSLSIDANRDNDSRKFCIDGVDMDHENRIIALID